MNWDAIFWTGVLYVLPLVVTWAACVYETLCTSANEDHIATHAILAVVPVLNWLPAVFSVRDNLLIPLIEAARRNRP